MYLTFRFLINQTIGTGQLLLRTVQQFTYQKQNCTFTIHYSHITYIYIFFFPIYTVIAYTPSLSDLPVWPIHGTVLSSQLSGLGYAHPSRLLHTVQRCRAANTRRKCGPSQMEKEFPDQTNGTGRVYSSPHETLSKWNTIVILCTWDRSIEHGLCRCPFTWTGLSID